MKTKQKLPIMLALVFQLFAAGAMAQADSCWTVLLLEKGKMLEQKEDMRSISSSGFYLHRNVIYQIQTNKAQQFSGRLVDIKPDTLYFTNYFNANVASKADAPLDTLGIHFSQLDKLHLVSDRSLGIYQKISFDRYDFIFEKTLDYCSIQSKWVKLYVNDSAPCEVVPHMTSQGINLLFEQNGMTYFYYGGGMLKPERSRMDTTYTTRRGLWFTPNNVEKVNGVAIGLMAENIKNDYYDEKDSLMINGLNLEINPFGFMVLLNPHLTGPYPDSIDYYKEHLQKRVETTVNGMHISVMNTINEARLNGVSLSGLVVVVDEIHGFSFSGLSSFSYTARGVTIAGLHNRATSMKGLQIGMYTKATDLRGIQIGLWNVNAKRSLPFINWQFRPKKH